MTNEEYMRKLADMQTNIPSYNSIKTEISGDAVSRQAIDNLRRYVDGKENTEKVEINVLQLNRIIKALEQEPCKDCISRQALLDAFGLSEKTRKWGGDHSGYNTMMLYEIQDVIESAPSVKPQEKVGYWIPIEYPTGVEAFGVKEMSAQELQCSECGKTVDISDGDFKYCPYCKTRMVEPQERNE